MARCKECGAEIFWAVNHRGSWIPLEPWSVDGYEDNDDGQPLYDPEAGHEKHFDYCGDGARSRGRSRQAAAESGQCNVQQALRALCVTDAAPAQVVKAAYRAMCIVHHPDHGGSTVDMQLINAAAEILRKAGRL